MNQRLIFILLFFFALSIPLASNYTIAASSGPGPVVPPGGEGGGTGTTIADQTATAGQCFNSIASGTFGESSFGDIVSHNAAEFLDSATAGDIYTHDASEFLAASDASIVKLSVTQTLTNKTLEDATTVIANASAPTSLGQFDTSLVTPGQTRVIKIPDANGTLLTDTNIGVSVAPVNNPVFTGVMTLPIIAGTDPSCAAAHYYWDSADTCGGTTAGAIHYCDNTPTDVGLCPYIPGSGIGISTNTVSLDINSLTAITTTVSPTADYLPIYNAATGVNKKVAPSYIGNGWKRSQIFYAGGMSVGGAASRTVDEVLVTNGMKRDTITLTAATTDVFDFDWRTPLNWDAGAIEVNIGLFDIANDSTDTLTIGCYGTCIATGEAIPAYSATGEQTATATFGNAANTEVQITTPAITLNAVSTCAAGAHVMMQCHYNTSSGTPTMASIRVLWANIIYGILKGSE